MTRRATTATTPPAASRRCLRFACHYVEMVVAMIVGMVVLAPLWPGRLGGLRGGRTPLVMADGHDDRHGACGWRSAGTPGARDRRDVGGDVRCRSSCCSCRTGSGAISGEALMIAGHVLMFPLMLAVMLLRRDEYAH